MLFRFVDTEHHNALTPLALITLDKFSVVQFKTGCYVVHTFATVTTDLK
jgi:hypothetical protein